MKSNIRIGSFVTVPSWPNSGTFEVRQDHGDEVTFVTGERIYKAKCVLDWRATMQAAKARAQHVSSPTKKRR